MVLWISNLIVQTPLSAVDLMQTSLSALDLMQTSLCALDLVQTLPNVVDYSADIAQCCGL